MKKIHNRILALLLSTVVAATVFTGCGTTGRTDTIENSEAAAGTDAADATQADTENDEGSVLNVAISSDPGSLDPAINIGDSLMYIFGLTEESLTRFGDDQKIVDGLADKIEHNDDYTQWTFHLRDSGWNNGDPVTADDWVFGITRLLDGSTEVAYPDFNYEIKNAREIFAGEVDPSELGVKAIDEKTVQFDLAYPVPYFEKLLTHCQHFGIDRAFVESIGGDANYGTNAETTLSNGPY